MGIGAMCAVMLRLPMTSVLLATLLLSSDGLAVMPEVIVAVAVAYVASAWLAPPPAASPEAPPAAARTAPVPGRPLAGPDGLTRSWPPGGSAPAAAAGGHPERAPNVLYVVFEDASIATWDAFGGLIDMPNMRRLAARGLRYSQWHTPALSALTRSCLLTGRDGDAGRRARAPGRAGPGLNGVIPAEASTLAEILAGHGYRTYCVGKWQLSAAEAFGMAGSRRAWPLRRGFDRYYGFLGSQTSNWYPDLVYDNQYVDQPYPPADGYHLSRDLADTAVDFLRDGSRTAPGRPWLCYLSFGANDAPQAAPREWIGNYRGRFGMGYDRYREIVLGNMKRLGVVPGSAELAPVDRWPTGAPGSEASPRRPWRALSDEQRQLSHRDAESYAGLCSYNDHQVGRLLGLPRRVRAAG